MRTYCEIKTPHLVPVHIAPWNEDTSELKTLLTHYADVIISQYSLFISNFVEEGWGHCFNQTFHHVFPSSKKYCSLHSTIVHFYATCTLLAASHSIIILCYKRQLLQQQRTTTTATTFHSKRCNRTQQMRCVGSVTNDLLIKHHDFFLVCLYINARVTQRPAESIHNINQKSTPYQYSNNQIKSYFSQLSNNRIKFPTIKSHLVNVQTIKSI
jgi:hypothetical protein